MRFRGTTTGKAIRRTPVRPKGDPYKTRRGGREICDKSPAGREEYARRREFCWDRDRGICCLCGLFVPLEQCTMEHLNGRGLGGSKRDDRPQACGVAHWFGNNAKGSISHELYMQKPLEERRRLCNPQ
jgi:5-methylcytosine-specific restriction endonuclease McrA